jgi:NADPH:quinone reductase-like Zn-dependent oxidoreductase
MRAITRNGYGGPETLELRNVDRPEPAEGRVLVRVAAASLNALDWHLLTGTPYFLRLVNGLRTPKQNGIGVDFAGIVEAVGPGVEGVKPGDAVYGAADGTCAEYVLAKAEYTLPLPEGVEFGQAATFNVAAITALQGLRDVGHVRAGQRVMINGAAGGVGTFAVQLAKLMGAHVTAVDSAEKLEMLRSIGADEVMDYGQEDFTAGGKRYDVIFDVPGRASFRRCVRALKPGGRLLLANARLSLLLRGRWTSLTSDKRVLVGLSGQAREDLDHLRELVEAGTLCPVIDRTYPLEEVPDAHRYVGTGAKEGNVVVLVA